MKKEQALLFEDSKKYYNMDGVRVVHIPKSVGSEPLGEGEIIGEGHFEGSPACSPLYYVVHFDNGEKYSMCGLDLKRVGV